VVTAALGAALIVVAVTVVSMAKASPRLGDGDAVARPAMAPENDQATTTATVRSLPPLLPSAASPLRVLEIGDSLGIDLGDQLRSQLDATAMARIVVASLGDSGLSNVSYYDWPAHLATLLDTDRPQVVVVFIGANDDQGLSVDGNAVVPGTPTWVAAYSGRVDDVVREATGAGARVVWVGMPPMADPDLDAAMDLEDAIYRSQSAAFPGALYVPSTPVLGSPSGGYETTGPGATGQPVVLRTPDGVHLTPAGAGVLAHAVIDAVDERWHLMLGPPPQSATTTPG
jgi:hypothetical protein